MELFDGKEWLTSPAPFPVGNELAEELEKLGYRLHLFVQACNQLYFQSVKGRQPGWIAGLLDRGKPPELVELGRRNRQEIPAVIRPDLILTDDGFVIAELDNVPGGIGLTGWLGETYAARGFEILGGAQGVVEGFRSITPQGADIVVSEESATYRPEMRWLADRLNERHAPVRWRVLDTNAAEWQPTVYRFFELFDLPNVACAPGLMASGSRVTPPFKPFLEEKLWFALFWLRPLREFWRRELGERHFLQLQRVIPYTWLLDPAPLPPHAVLPGLEVHDWSEVAAFSQKERNLILKISGFSELAWGGRGVHVAADLPQHEWRTVLEQALGCYERQPYVLQEFRKGRLVEQPWVDERGETQRMRGRVRLCPYYFVAEGRANLGGALATVCPADKKLIHGMRDAVLMPAGVN